MDPEKRPEPVGIRALAVAAAAAAVHALVVRGWIPALSGGTEQAIAAGVIDLAGAYITWRWSRPHVTPTADPRQTESVRLVPAGPDGQPAPAATLSDAAVGRLREVIIGEVLEQLAGAPPRRQRTEPPATR